MREPVVFVLKGYPRLSETFIAEEIRALERAGLDIRIVALRRPTDRTVHPVHREIVAPVTYLPEYLHRAPLRVLHASWSLRRAQGLAAAWRAFVADFRRDPTRNRVRRLGQALVLAAELPPGAHRLHAHFLHTPASVVRYAALLLGLPWTSSAHAKDIWTTPDWDLADKLLAARWTVTCTRAGRDRLQSLSPPGKPVHLVYHGLRLDRFQPLLPLPSRRDGRDPAEPVRILAVGRAVPKKGFDTLLDALARLPADRTWRLTHIGGGPELKRLRARASANGLADRIAWLGARDQAFVLAAYRAADLFVLPCRVAPDGDRDGLPNVLVEAQSQGLACLSTAVGGVSELIAHGRSGVLVPPGDPGVLAEALDALIVDPETRARYGRAGAERVRRSFDARRSVAALVALFGGADLPLGSAAAE